MGTDMRTLRAVACALMLSITASACTSAPEASLSPAESPLTTPLSEAGAEASLESSPQPLEPEAGKAALSGVLYTFTGNGPIPGTVFYLTPALGEEEPRPPLVLTGPHAEAGEIAGVSDTRGRFALNNIPPGNYYLVVWAPYNWILATKSDTDMDPLLITLEPDQRLDLGLVFLSWP